MACELRAPFGGATYVEISREMHLAPWRVSALVFIRAAAAAARTMGGPVAPLAPLRKLNAIARVARLVFRKKWCVNRRSSWTCDRQVVRTPFNCGAAE